MPLVEAEGPGEDLDQRALAGAVVADQGRHLTGLGLEVDLAEDLDVAEALADPPGLEHGGHRRSPPAVNCAFHGVPPRPSRRRSDGRVIVTSMRTAGGAASPSPGAPPSPRSRDGVDRLGQQRGRRPLDALVGERLEEPRHREPGGVAGAAGRRQHVVGSRHALVGVGDGAPRTDEDRPVVAQRGEVEVVVGGVDLEVLGRQVVHQRGRGLLVGRPRDRAVVAPRRPGDRLRSPVRRAGARPPR